jgi:hypothetical protein
LKALHRGAASYDTHASLAVASAKGTTRFGGGRRGEEPSRRPPVVPRRGGAGALAAAHRRHHPLTDELNIVVGIPERQPFGASAHLVEAFA